MVVKGPGPMDEAFHAELSVEEEVVWRWGVDNGTMVERQGRPGDGTSVDFEEPVVLT